MGLARLEITPIDMGDQPNDNTIILPTNERPRKKLIKQSSGLYYRIAMLKL